VVILHMWNSGITHMSGRIRLGFLGGMAVGRLTMKMCLEYGFVLYVWPNLQEVGR
jgi:hypothetical protein